MLESDRQFMLHTLYTSATESKAQEPAGHVPKSRQQWYILGRRLCVRGFVALLGIGETRICRGTRLAIDGLRYLLDAGPILGRNTAQLYRCHHFLCQLYTAVAEVLPKYTTNGAGSFT